MRQIGWTGYCPNDQTELALRLRPTDGVVNGLLPSATRVTEMFEIEVKCPECGEWVEPDGLRPTA